MYAREAKRVDVIEAKLDPHSVWSIDDYTPVRGQDNAIIVHGIRRKGKSTVCKWLQRELHAKYHNEFTVVWYNVWRPNHSEPPISKLMSGPLPSDPVGKPFIWILESMIPDEAYVLFKPKHLTWVSPSVIAYDKYWWRVDADKEFHLIEQE